MRNPSLEKSPTIVALPSLLSHRNLVFLCFSALVNSSNHVVSSPLMRDSSNLLGDRIAFATPATIPNPPITSGPDIKTKTETLAPLHGMLASLGPFPMERFYGVGAVILL